MPKPKRTDMTFAEQVYAVLMQVPPGQVVTYGGLALLAGPPERRPGGGHADGPKPLRRLLPCHRVVSSTGGSPPGNSGRSRPAASGKRV